MRDQYAGDIRDLVKYSFLRALAGDDRQLGLGWYYNPSHDGRADGRHIEWREEIAWRQLDTLVFDALSSLNLSARSVAGIERLAIWPNGTVFHRDPIQTGGRRASWLSAKQAALANANLIFLDPDTGLGKPTPRHITADEVKGLRQSGRTIAFIMFPGHNLPHHVQLERLHRDVGGRIMTLQVNTPVQTTNGFAPRICWFVIADYDDVIFERTQQFAINLRSIPRVIAHLVISPVYEEEEEEAVNHVAPREPQKLKGISYLTGRLLRAILRRSGISTSG